MIVTCLLDENLKQVDLDTIDQFTPECGSNVVANTNPRVFKEHSPKFDLFPKVIYNYRDGRDCIVSAHKYAVDSLGYSKCRLTFLTDRDAQIFGFWHEHMEKALEYQNSFPSRILMLRFEDLKQDPDSTIREIANFLGKRISDSRVSQIIQLTDLGLQKTQNADKQDVRMQNTLGTGAVGGWKEKLEPAETRIFEGMASRMLRRFNYPLSSDGQS